MKIEVKIPSGLIVLTILNVIFGITSLVYGTSFFVLGISRLFSDATTNGSVPKATDLLPFGIPSLIAGVALIFTSEAFLEGKFKAYMVAMVFYIIALVRGILMIMLPYSLVIIAMPPSPLDVSIVYFNVNPIFPGIATVVICITAFLFLLTPNVQKWFIQKK